VARITCLRESYLHVVRVRRPLKILQMARNTSGDSDLVIVRYVAVDALARRHRVRTRQHEASGRMIKRCAGPSSSVVTLLACLREAALNVVRIRGPLEIFQVARNASRNGDVVVVRYVAIDALARRYGVGSRQRKAGGRVIERRSGPRSRAVTLLTSLREASLNMVRACGSLKIFEVARNTS